MWQNYFGTITRYFKLESFYLSPTIIIKIEHIYICIFFQHDSNSQEKPLIKMELEMVMTSVE